MGAAEGAETEQTKLSAGAVIADGPHFCLYPNVLNGNKNPNMSYFIQFLDKKETGHHVARQPIYSFAV